MLTHNRIELALHTLRAADGPNLLLLHGLGEASPAELPAFASGWTGGVYALDFTGHGASTMPVGGGYTAEIMMADADIALRHLERATVVGRGLGAYVALLIAGARAEQVSGAVLADGPGLSGGPTVPTSQPVVNVQAVETPPDPHAIVELGRDLRPADYATTFVRLANEGSSLDTPITVTARFKPTWLRAVVGEPGVREAPSIAEAIAHYA
jgi:pimeloyl-ACP methyl ester carboxylesterase